MESSKFILRCLFLFVPESFFYLVEYTNFDAHTHSVYDKEVVSYLLSLGAEFERSGHFITLRFKDLRMVFDY